MFKVLKKVNERNSSKSQEFTKPIKGERTNARGRKGVKVTTKTQINNKRARPYALHGTK